MSAVSSPLIFIVNLNFVHVVAKGVSANMLKDTSKRRRTQAQMKKEAVENYAISYEALDFSEEDITDSNNGVERRPGSGTSQGVEYMDKTQQSAHLVAEAPWSVAE